MKPTFRHVEAGLWGLLVGDAVGVPYEFHPPQTLPPTGEIDLLPPPSFSRSYSHIEPGTWSDDGAQALCLASSLIECPAWDVDDFAARLLRWHKRGYLAVDGRVFDIGVQTGSALRRLLEGTPPLLAGLAGERNNGNGGLMRSLPVALLVPGDDSELVRVAHEQSAVTHRHPRSQVCCSLYCLWARREMEQTSNPWEAAVDALRALLPAGSDHRRELEEVILPAAANPPRGTGYVVDALHSARVACKQPTYETVVQSAIAFGNDTDTTACIAGGIAGIRHGREGIPARWHSGLRGRPLLDSVLHRARVRLGS